MSDAFDTDETRRPRAGRALERLTLARLVHAPHPRQPRAPETMIKRHLIAAGFVGACLALPACSSHKNEATIENFAKAVSAELERRGARCDRIDDLPAAYPVAKIEALRGVSGGPDGLEALARAGVLTETNSTVKVGNVPGDVRVPGKRFEQADAGKPFIDDKGHLCYGRLALDRIVSWTTPTATAGVTETVVTYQYRLEGLPDWARRPDVQKAWPDIAKLVAGAGHTPMRMPLVQTEDGWMSE
jgi:hypothetical protein